jgi:hypothetical protein
VIAFHPDVIEAEYRGEIFQQNFAIYEAEISIGSGDWQLCSSIDF